MLKWLLDPGRELSLNKIARSQHLHLYFARIYFNTSYVCLKFASYVKEKDGNLFGAIQFLGYSDTISAIRPTIVCNKSSLHFVKTNTHIINNVDQPLYLPEMGLCNLFLSPKIWLLFPRRSRTKRWGHTKKYTFISKRTFLSQGIQ